MSVLPPGTAPIKPEYILSVSSQQPDDDAAENATNHAQGAGSSTTDDRDKKPGFRGKRLSKQEKKAQRGSNKGRRFKKVRDEVELCWRVANGRTCEFGSECRFTHDVPAYLTAKPEDISMPPASSISVDTPFAEIAEHKTVCPIFAETGDCRYGFKCRFLASHVAKDDKGELVLVKDEDKMAHSAVSAAELNDVTSDRLKLVRNRKYPTPVTDAYLKELQVINEKEQNGGRSQPINDEKKEDSGAQLEQNQILSEPIVVVSENSNKPLMDVNVSPDQDTPDVPMRFSEKKRLNWSGKTYLAPLTTVGNLPFRRLCVDFGADITCGEMGLANSFLSGSKEEWSLIRRHPSERNFGIQMAGNKPQNLVAAAEVIAKECPSDIDFVDINCGCPIDLVFNSGSGSALLDSAGKLGKILVGMNRALGQVPVTVKLRTGVRDNAPVAHKLMPRLATEWNAGCLTLHGRSRQARYSKTADWDYIKQCVKAVRIAEEKNDTPPIPIFGGGDCFSSQDYWEKVEYSGVDGVMIGRGALIKPWIFTEVAEHREWDISPQERLEGIRKYAEYGLSHFGTDTAGVGTTRRYLCEALSFQYRYVPIGLLEVLPGRMNDRPPSFRGRNELETLLASGDSRDWIKISEMFLGPAPESWTFMPKHKSNSYESQG